MGFSCEFLVGTKTLPEKPLYVDTYGRIGNPTYKQSSISRIGNPTYKQSCVSRIGNPTYKQSNLRETLLHVRKRQPDDAEAGQ